MAHIGINVARDGSISPSLVRSLGATWIRVVATHDNNLRAYLQACRDVGLRVLMVLARESFADTLSKDARLRQYDDLYRELVDAWQVGNEPDLESESSWTMPQQEFVQLGQLTRLRMPAAHLVAGGLASGQTNWLAGVDLAWADSVGVHPYLKDARNPNDLEDLQDVQDLLADYQDKVGSLPLVITEWGWWGDEERRATEETRDMIAWAAGTLDIGAFFYFCASDTMVPPFGLVSADGGEKDRATAFRVASRQPVAGDWPRMRPASTLPVAPVIKPVVNPWKWWTPDILAATIGCPVSAVTEHWPRLAEQMAHAGIYEMRVAAAMAATVAIETAHRFQPIHEFPDWNRYPNSGGYPPHYEGGSLYHGRGFIQVTHLGNYRKYGQQIAQLWGAGGWEPDFDWVRNPDNALDPDQSAAAAALYFKNHGGDGLELVANAARQEDWTEVRRLVQGGAAGLADFTEYASQLVAMAQFGNEEETDDPREAQIEGYKTAIRHLVDVVLPNAAATAAEFDDAAKRRADALAEGVRIRKQYVGN